MNTEDTRTTGIDVVEPSVEGSGNYAACPYCCEVWPNEMLRDDKRMPEHNFADFRAMCAGSAKFPVAPTVAQVRAWKEQEK